MEDKYYKKYEPLFGSWYIKRKIGSGSFGSVFEIEREDFGTTYKAALKAITIPQDESEIASYRSEGLSDDEINEELYQFTRELVAEFELMSKLKGNSNIVSYEDHKVIKREDGIGWDILIRMELLTPLVDHIKNNTLHISDVIRLGIDMCKALELCQKFNIIHRDIKPENIFISQNGDYKLGDFGIARQIEKTTFGLSKKGTYNYMAPEVYKGQKYGTGVDMYSLGIVLYRLLNQNRAPFMPPYPEKITHTMREQALIKRMSGEQLPPPVSLKDGRLVEIIYKAAAYHPKDRYSSPVQMKEDLIAIQYDYSEYLMINPGGDSVAIKSVNYEKTGTAEEETEMMLRTGDGNETEVMSGIGKASSFKEKKNHIRFLTKKKIILTAIAVAIVCSSVFIAVNVNRSDDESIPSPSVDVVTRIEEDSVRIVPGESANIRELTSNVSFYSNTTYRSDNEGIITVDGEGKITAQKEGEAYVICDSDADGDGINELEAKIRVISAISDEEVQAVAAKKNELIDMYNVSYNVLQKALNDSSINQQNIVLEKDALTNQLAIFADMIDKARRLTEITPIVNYYNDNVTPATRALEKAYDIAYDLAHPVIVPSSSKTSGGSSKSTSGTKSSSSTSKNSSSGSSSTSKSSSSGSSSTSKSSSSSRSSSSGSGSSSNAGSGSVSGSSASSSGSSSSNSSSSSASAPSSGGSSSGNASSDTPPQIVLDFD